MEIMENLTYSEKHNLAILVSLLQDRLSSKGKVKNLDEHGNEVYTVVDIFGKTSLENFLILSLSEFNQTPKFSNFNLEQDHFVYIFSDILVEGAVLHALASKALLEKGREFKSEDRPSIADMMQTQYSILLTHHFEKLRLIKSHIESHIHYMETNKQ